MSSLKSQILKNRVIDSEKTPKNNETNQIEEFLTAFLKLETKVQT